MPKAWGTVWRVNSNDILAVQDAAALTNYKVEQKISETGRGENTMATEKSTLVYSADWGVHDGSSIVHLEFNPIQDRHIYAAN